MMPTVLRIGGYRFFFYSNEGQEPPHVHVETSGNLAKFWLSTVVLASSRGFNTRELNELQRLVEEHQQQLLEAWNDFFG